MRRNPLLALFVTLVLAGVACSLAPRPPANVIPTPSPRPSPSPSFPPVAAPAVPSSDPNVVASAPPLQPMPAPGQMPADSYMRTIQDRGTLRAGIYQDVLLFGYLNPLSN